MAVRPSTGAFGAVTIRASTAHAPGGLGLLLHVVGLVWLGTGTVRTQGWVGIGPLALLMAALHVLWLPAGALGDAGVVADQALIGLAWVGIGVLSARPPR